MRPSLSFAKEAVAPLASISSSLTASLHASSLTAPRAASHRTPTTSFDIAPECTRSEGYTVSQVVTAVLEVYQRHLGTPGPPLVAERYALLVAEDDGTTADPDFPEIDASVAITSVGVDKFVLSERAGPEGSYLLRCTIPTAAIALRACEAGANGSGDQLLVTCYPASTGPGLADCFTALLADGGRARPPPGVAAPSAQARGLLAGQTSTSPLTAGGAVRGGGEGEAACAGDSAR